MLEKVIYFKDTCHTCHTYATLYCCTVVNSFKLLLLAGYVCYSLNYRLLYYSHGILYLSLLYFWTTDYCKIKLEQIFDFEVALRSLYI